MSKFNINSMISDIKDRGVQRSHSFEVDIPVPEYMRKKYSSSEKINTRCENTTIPGINLASVDAPPKYGYGPVERIPYVPTYMDTQLQFILDRNSSIYEFFYDWVNCIVNIDNSNGLDAKNDFGFQTYEVGYKNSYSVDMRVSMLDEKRKKRATVIMMKTYPTHITPIDMNWSDSDTIVKLQVGFSYREHKIEFVR